MAESKGLQAGSRPYSVVLLVVAETGPRGNTRESATVVGNLDPGHFTDGRVATSVCGLNGDCAISLDEPYRIKSQLIPNDIDHRYVPVKSSGTTV